MSTIITIMQYYLHRALANILPHTFFMIMVELCAKSSDPLFWACSKNKLIDFWNVSFNILYNI